MPELTKLRKDHDAKNAATVATESNIPSNAGLTVEIRIPADLATTSNRQVFFHLLENQFYVVQVFRS
jgi:hypothetical protein